MPLFDVTISRAELITFRIQATDRDDALDRYWDGDEVASKTTDITVESAGLAAP